MDILEVEGLRKIFLSRSRFLAKAREQEETQRDQGRGRCDLQHQSGRDPRNSRRERVRQIHYLHHDHQAARSNRRVIKYKDATSPP